MRRVVNVIFIVLLLTVVSCGQMKQVEKIVSNSDSSPSQGLDQLGFEPVHPSEFIPQDLHCEEPSEYIPEDLYCAGY